MMRVSPLEFTAPPFKRRGTVSNREIIKCDVQFFLRLWIFVGAPIFFPSGGDPLHRLCFLVDPILGRPIWPFELHSDMGDRDSIKAEWTGSKSSSVLELLFKAATNRSIALFRFANHDFWIA
jgi:hypothetical protein